MLAGIQPKAGAGSGGSGPHRPRPIEDEDAVFREVHDDVQALVAHEWAGCLDLALEELGAEPSLTFEALELLAGGTGRGDNDGRGRNNHTLHACPSKLSRTVTRLAFRMVYTWATSPPRINTIDP